MSKLLVILSYISVLLSTHSSFSWCSSAEEDEIISEFQQYLRIPTAHPNPNYKPAQDFIVSKAKSIGLNIQILEFAEGKPVILLTWTGKNPTWPSILLNSHLDSVPAEPEKWVHDPFQAIKDIKGNIYARGSQDDKCIGMQYLEAINRLKTKGYQPLRTVRVSFVPDEEIGGRDGAGAFASSKEFKNLHVGFVLDEGQASPDENYRVFYAERIPWNLIIRATGAPGHGAKLYDNSALENLMRSMEAIARFRSAQFDLVKAGLAEPGEVIAVNPVYVKAGTPTHTIIEKGPIRSIQGHPLLTVANGSNPWWLRFEQAILATGGKLRKPEILASTTDARFVRAQGIPTFGFSPMANTPILLHDHNEFLNEGEYLKGIEVYEAIIESLSSFLESDDNISSKDEL